MKDAELRGEGPGREPGQGRKRSRLLLLKKLANLVLTKQRDIPALLLPEINGALRDAQSSAEGADGGEMLGDKVIYMHARKFNMLYPGHVKHAVRRSSDHRRMHWGQRLREEREARGLSQKEIGGYADDRCPEVSRRDPEAGEVSGRGR